MKGAGRYLDYITYYKGELATDKLQNCHQDWHRERHKQTKDIRLRAKGCGDTHVCPLCSSYKQSRLAGEAFDEIVLAQEALDIDQVEVLSYGLKLVLTLHKDMSLALDSDLFDGQESWRLNIDALNKKISKLIRRWFGSGCGFLVGLDLTGESNPTEPHYHFNVYLFPARKVGNKWIPLPKWIEPDGEGLTLQAMRKDWAKSVSGVFPHELDEMDVSCRYISKLGALHNWLDYQYRPVLSDLWRGWRGFDGQSIQYEYRKPNRPPERLLMPREDGLRALERVNLVPPHFKRLRWCGVFSDGQRSKTMQALGLSKKEIPEGDETKNDWETFGDALRFVRYTPAGVVLRELDGSDIEFPDGVIHYGPFGVALGKRTRWRAPGDC